MTRLQQREREHVAIPFGCDDTHNHIMNHYPTSSSPYNTIFFTMRLHWSNRQKLALLKLVWHPLD
jgi:hypothetical protein